uniref:Major facilitator superfamily (MFS) profile domain-containing protein n=1 Tax=Ciona savignyi TaxID=51511 RepID=H2YPY8_CIOSA
MQLRGGNVVLETVGSILVMIGRFGISGSFACIYIQGPQLFPTSGRTTAIGLCSMAARIGAIITPFSLQAQMDIPWLTPVIFGIAAFIAATISLTFPKTSGKQLTSNFTQAEQFFKSHFHTNVFTKLPFLKSKRSSKKSEETEIMMKKITSPHKNKECV